MCAKKAKTTKKKIVSAAWKLFYEQGYDNTTVDDIVEESGTSKGSFYHYFEGKDALLSSLSFLFDEKYEELMPSVDPQMHSVDKLLYLNRELFGVIENTVSLELLARLFSSQLITKGERHLLDSSRVYYKILRQIISEGQQRGQIRSDITANEISKLYAVAERGVYGDTEEDRQQDDEHDADEHVPEVDVNPLAGEHEREGRGEHRRKQCGAHGDGDGERHVTLCKERHDV